MKEIKKRLEKELSAYLKRLDTSFGVTRISPLLFGRIKEFALRDGKRVRPTLFVIGYLGYARKAAAGLYASALSLELLHDFMLVHDDIIDKSPLRRGLPSMHKLFEKDIRSWKGAKFSGEDMAIVAGDVMYAMALSTFLSIKEDPVRKEQALRKLIEAALYTGSGEFIELVLGARSMEALTPKDIYKIYDLKTAYYTFAYPLTMGAVLAGASASQVKLLEQYGLFLGRAFQIKDDIIGMFGEEKEIGKSTLTDLKEAKKTLLVWMAYRNSPARDRAAIKRIMEKENAVAADLLQMREIVTRSGALEANRKEISRLIRDALALSGRLTVAPRYRKFLQEYPAKILSV